MARVSVSESTTLENPFIQSRFALVYEECHQRYRAVLREALSAYDSQVVDEWERAGHVDPQIFRDLGSAGCFAERWEAGRLDGLPYSVVLAEETSRLGGGVNLALSIHAEIFTGALTWLAVNDYQKQLLQRAIAGEAIGCLASTEPEGGSDLLGLRTSLTRCSEGWRLQGEKRYTSNAGTADHVLVVASDPASQRGINLSLAVVPLDFPGVEVVGFFDKVGIKSCDAAHLRFDAIVPEDMLLGRPGAGLIYISSLLQHERIAVSAELLAAARMCLAMTVAFARRRVHSGVPLIERQALRHRLADARTATWVGEAMLATVVNAARSRRDVSYQTAALKLYCATTVGKVIDECLQMFGGRGYTTNFPLERAWRDARLARIGGGADEVMREVIAAGMDHADGFYDQLIENLELEDCARVETESQGSGG